jgi:hypothetical protein
MVLLATSACFSKVCDLSTCPSGCCNEEALCVSGTAKVECGRKGNACQVCRSATQCLGQQCALVEPDDAGTADGGPTVCTCANSCCLADGSCSPNNAVEACGPAQAFCGRCGTGQRCEGGTCVASPCMGCLDPLGVCHSGVEQHACGAAGQVCASCGGDQSCSGGACIFTRCDESNCRFGCCLPDKRCLASTSHSCGVNGQACVSCTSTQSCIAGVCQ